MTEMQNTMKVYELAKELGMDSFGTLDLLKSIGVEVKNHMSSLEGPQIEAVRAHLKKPASGSGSKEKKASTKKTSTRKATAATSAGAPAKSTARARAGKASEAKTDSSATSGRKVVRRRTTGDEEATLAPVEKISPTTHEEAFENVEQELEAVAVHAPAQDEPTAEIEAVAQVPVEEELVAVTPEPESMKEIVAPEEPAARVVAPPVAPPTHTVTTPPVRTIIRSNNPTAKPPAPVGRDLRSKPTTIIRKAGEALLEDEMLEGSFGQRRLKIVQNAPPEAPKAKEAKAGETGARPGKRFDDFSTNEVGKGLFKPVTSVLSEKEDEEKKRRSAQERTVEEIRISDFRKREVIFQPKRRKLPPGKITKKTEITTPGASKRKIRIEGVIRVAELAQRMGEKPALLMRKLMDMGTEIANLNHELDLDTATLLANEFKYEIENVTFDETKYLGEETDDEASLVNRPPVITVMGHVDHGKTTLLDAIRNASVAAGEAGGITQHIGAYSVSINGQPITFLDTPGHEAFREMRQRGANATDIVVLVVAADDGIMPQTKEAIALAQAAGVAIIVAANKVDKPEANLDRLKQMLSEQSVLVEDWGGEVPFVPVSALKKKGIKELLETIQVQAEVLELKANPKRAARGSIIESRMVLGRGIVTDALVTNGTLKSGDHIVCGTSYGRVRAMMNDQGKVVKEVLPGFPVEFGGLDDVPSPGETFYVVPSENAAKEIVEHRREEQRKTKEKASERKPFSMEEFFADTGTSDQKMLNIMLKADVFGSVEAIAESVLKIPADKVGLKIISKGVGTITENDVILAKTSNAHIFAFNVKTETKAKDTAKREQVTVHSLSIIYELLDKVRETMESLLDPIRIERPIGKAEVKQAFTVSKIGLVAGSMVTDGKITRNAWAKVFRGSSIVVEGTVTSLKRFKDDAKETIKGQECGIGVDKYVDIQAGDRIEAFHVEFEKAKL